MKKLKYVVLPPLEKNTTLFELTRSGEHFFRTEYNKHTPFAIKSAASGIGWWCCCRKGVVNTRHKYYTIYLIDGALVFTS